MRFIKILEQRNDKNHHLKHAILNFFISLETKDFLLTSKQLFKIFNFMEGYSCTRKDFLKELHSLVNEGFLRQLIEEKNILYELNLTRFEMEKHL